MSAMCNETRPDTQGPLPLQKQREQLEGDNLVHDPLVDQVCQERRCGQAHRLVVALVCTPELHLATVARGGGGGSSSSVRRAAEARALAGRSAPSSA